MTRLQSPLNGTQLVDEYFIENRNRLLEVAAFLDRLDRAGADGTPDFRMAAFHDALVALTTAGPNRLHRIQLIFSDPTTEPRPALDRKGAVGAYEPPGRGDRS
ncbi:MAG: hypothetical protein IT184_04945 [Acidobacteria bacterium]|nr:hypothetical protein [Acidobacteriota bacterium]